MAYSPSRSEGMPAKMAGAVAAGAQAVGHCIHGQEAERDDCPGAQLTFSSFLFYSAWGPSSWDGVTYIHPIPSLIKPLWECPHRHVQRCISQEILKPNK